MLPVCSEVTENIMYFLPVLAFDTCLLPSLAVLFHSTSVGCIQPGPLSYYNTFPSSSSSWERLFPFLLFCLHPHSNVLLCVLTRNSPKFCMSPHPKEVGFVLPAYMYFQGGNCSEGFDFYMPGFSLLWQLLGYNIYHLSLQEIFKTDL